MVRALVDIGPHMPLVTATVAVTLECSGLQNVKLAVANQPSDGNPLIQDEILFTIHVNYITGIYNDVTNVHMYYVCIYVCVCKKMRKEKRKIYA